MTSERARLMSARGRLLSGNAVYDGRNSFILACSCENSMSKCFLHSSSKNSNMFGGVGCVFDASGAVAEAYVTPSVRAADADVKLVGWRV